MSRLFAAMKVSVILTFDTAPQAFYTAEVHVPLISGLTPEQLDEIEVETVCQILGQYEGEGRDQLAKISLCYVGDLSKGPIYQQVFDHLIRNNAKYYFQPNQRGRIENLIAKTAGVANLTKAYA